MTRAVLPTRNELTRTALEALRRSTGIEGVLLNGSGSEFPPADELLELQQGEQSARFVAIVKPHLRLVHLAALREMRAHLPHPLLVITDHVTAPLAQELREEGLPFLDTAGNAFLETSSWFVLVIGQPKPTAPPRERPLPSSVWRVAYVLLRCPSAEKQRVRVLAEQAGVAPSAAQGAIEALEARGWLVNLGRRGQQVTDRMGLWRAWEGGYIDRLGPKLHLAQATPLGFPTLRQWGQTVTERLGPETALLGGELAAECHGTDIMASTATLHVERWDADLMRSLRLVPSEKGAITIRRKMGALDHDAARPELADPLLVRAELLTIVDERLDESRRMLSELIQQRWEKA
jgi:hypothetical protein